MNGLAGLAHDMRAPLAAVDALCALIDAHADNPSALRRDAARLREACAQLAQIAEALLNGGSMALHPAPCTPEEIVRAAAALYAGRVELNMTGDSGALMLADACAVRRILVNLLSNAVKYSEGRVALRAHAERREETIFLRIEVEDSGVGMGEETMAVLFMPGVRGAEAAGVPGHGIGLSAAAELAKAMGGEIAARSRVGEGSLFTFSASFARAKRCCKGLAGRRFLVAEDNALAREALCELLEAHGAQAVAVEDGETAVAAFARSPQGGFDAVLMDVVMPGMGGFEAVRAIREMDRTDAKSVLMIALTGAASQEAEQAARRLCMRHAVKPLSMGQLERILGE